MATFRILLANMADEVGFDQLAQADGLACNGAKENKEMSWR